MEAVGSCSLRIQVWQRTAEGGPKSERTDGKGDVIRDIVKNVVGGMGVREDGRTRASRGARRHQIHIFDNPAMHQVRHHQDDIRGT